MYEEITIERLHNFSELKKEYERLLRFRANLTQKIGTIHGIDYSKDRVQTGNGHKASEQEHFAESLERINFKIREVEAVLFPEKEIIKTQIARVPKRDYRKLLIFRYIEGWKWSEIVQEFFEFETDYEDEKLTKYRDTVMYWNRRALAELEKVSAKPYVKVEKQLTLN